MNTQAHLDIFVHLLTPGAQNDYKFEDWFG